MKTNIARYTKQMRDNFSQKVKQIVARRVGYRCSNPNCRRLTTGPQTEDSKAVNLGVCAHITAAAPGGPRYDPKIASDERKSATNAIWLCQFCAKLIDDDYLKYSIDELHRWKLLAEDEARKEIEAFLKDITRSNQGVVWIWDNKKSTYRNLKTGAIVDPRKIIELRDDFLNKLKASIDEIVDELFEGNLTIQEWQTRFQKDLKYAYIIGFTLASGGKNSLTDEILEEIGIVLKKEFKLLYDFAVDIAEGKYGYNDAAWEIKHVKLRARSFLERVRDEVAWP